MTDAPDHPFTLFSASATEIGAACPVCGRILSVARGTYAATDDGFTVPGMLTCPCGNRSSEIHRPPPAPQSPEAEPSTVETVLVRSVVWGLLLAVAVGVGYLLFAAFGVLSGIGDAADAPTPELSASVEISSAQIHVTNNDAFDWGACTVTLNAGLGGSWSQDVGQIAAGETVSGGLMAFTRGRGERFNPFTHAVEDILLDCATPSGRAHWSGQF